MIDERYQISLSPQKTETRWSIKKPNRVAPVQRSQMSCFHTCLGTLLNHPLDVKIPILKNSNPLKLSKKAIKSTLVELPTYCVRKRHLYCFTLQIDTHNKLIILRHIWSVFFRIMHMFNIHLLVHCSQWNENPPKSHCYFKNFVCF